MPMVPFFASFINIFFDLLSFAIIARILLSWLRTGGAVRLRMALHDITEPVLAPFRNVIPHIGVIDISPIVALLALDIVKSVLLYLLNYLALSL